MKFKKTLTISIFLLILALAIFFLFFSRQKTEFSINNQKFQMEISKTGAEREEGLSGRNNLCKNCGMLFVFSEEGKHGFWMKEMKFDLDIAWISKGKIVYIAKNVSRNFKEIIIPETDADRVLELKAGTADELGIRVGDKIKF
jgi:hypothetical protein